MEVPLINKIGKRGKKMNNLKLNLTSHHATEFLTGLLPIAHTITTRSEHKAFGCFIGARYERLLSEYPLQADDLRNAYACLSGATLASLENHTEDNGHDND